MIRAIYGVLLIASIGVGVIGLVASRRATVIVEWTTASEVDTVGFNLYRSQSPGTDSVRVNQNLIPASNDPLAGGSYEYKDRNLIPGRTYSYELEEIQAEGGTSRFGPIEVKAERGGMWEILVASVLTVTSLVGLRFSLRKRKEQPLSFPLYT